MNANLNTIKDFDQICRICLKEQSCLMAIRKEFLQYLTEIAGVKVRKLRSIIKILNSHFLGGC